MFLDRAAEARAVYISPLDEKFSAKSYRTWREAVLDDFAQFRKAGLSRPLLVDIATAFSNPAVAPAPTVAPESTRQ